MFRFSHRHLLSLSALLACASSAFAAPISSGEKQQVLEVIQQVLSQRAYLPGIDFATWPQVLGRHEAAITAANDTAAFQRAVNDALKEFRISHLIIQAPRGATVYKRAVSSRWGLTYETACVGLRVLDVKKDGPAYQAGLAKGDLIVEVDGRRATSIEDFSNAVENLLEIKIRETSGEERAVALSTATTIRLKSVEWLKPKIASLKIGTFGAARYSFPEMEAAFKEIENSDGLILDLRGNGGGVVHCVEHCLGFFLRPGTPVGSYVSRTSVHDYQSLYAGQAFDLAKIADWAPEKLRAMDLGMLPYKGKIAVLIDARSGSAAEILADALRREKKAVIIGKRSAGAVLISVFARLPLGFRMQYPMSDYVTMTGERLEGKGVSPDLEMDTAKVEGQDPALEEALKAIS